MNLTLEQFVDQAPRLPSEARAPLADRLVESLDPSEDGYVRQIWMAEAQRRGDEIHSGRVQTISAEQALTQVRRALGRRQRDYRWRNEVGAEDQKP